MTEIWKDVEGYEGLYSISNRGYIRSLVTDRSRREGVLTPHPKNGYLAVNLYKDGKCKHHYIHRLVAKAFISNPLNKRTVNHKDADKHNNCVENLEWCTQKQNIHHSVVNGLQPRLLKTEVDGVEYPSMKQASVESFGKYWLIQHLRYAHGNDFMYNGKSIHIVEVHYE